jgi:hypothetical protein
MGQQTSGACRGGKVLIPLARALRSTMPSTACPDIARQPSFPSFRHGDEQWALPRTSHSQPVTHAHERLQLAKCPFVCGLFAAFCASDRTSHCARRSRRARARHFCASQSTAVKTHEQGASRAPGRMSSMQARNSVCSSPCSSDRPAGSVSLTTLGDIDGALVVLGIHETKAPRFVRKRTYGWPLSGRGVIGVTVKKQGVVLDILST